MSKIRSKLKLMIVLLVSMLLLGNAYGAYYAFPDLGGSEQDFSKEIEISDNHTIKVTGKYITKLGTPKPPSQPRVGVGAHINIYTIKETIKYTDESGTPVIETNEFSTTENGHSSYVSNGTKYIKNKLAGLNLCSGTSMGKQAMVIQEPEPAANFYSTIPEIPDPYNGSYQEFDPSSVSSHSAFRGFCVGVEVYPHSILESYNYPNISLTENEPSAVTTHVLYITFINANGELETKHIFSPHATTVSWHYEYLSN